MMGKPVGRSVQLGIRKRRIPTLHRDRTRRRSRLIGDQLMQTPTRIVPSRPIPLNQQLIPLLGGQDRQRPHRLGAVGRRRREHHLQVPDEPVGRPQAGAVRPIVKAVRPMMELQLGAVLRLTRGEPRRMAGLRRVCVE